MLSIKLDNTWLREQISRREPIKNVPDAVFVRSADLPDLIGTAIAVHAALSTLMQESAGSIPAGSEVALLVEKLKEGRNTQQLQ